MAGGLVLSERTVEDHVSGILRKLGFSSRPKSHLGHPARTPSHERSERGRADFRTAGKSVATA